LADAGNSSSLHSLGQKARRDLEQARAKIAALIKAKPSEIVFTGSATESNNTVLFGLARRHLIISGIEHASISEPARALEKRGVKITQISPDKNGLIDPKKIESSIDSETDLVSIIHGSNEIGTIQDIDRIAKICKKKGVLFHTDAVASFARMPIDVKNISLLTASSHKIGGPMGIAMLYVKEGIKLAPMIYGGGQENGLRSGTVNVLGAVEFSKHCVLKDYSKIVKLRDYLIDKVLEIEGAHLTGHKTKRLSYHASFWFNNVEGDALVLELDKYGVLTSTGSACASFSFRPSPALLAIGLDSRKAGGSLRVSLGEETTFKDIDYFLKILSKIILDKGVGSKLSLA